MSHVNRSRLHGNPERIFGHDAVSPPRVSRVEGRGWWRTEDVPQTSRILQTRWDPGCVITPWKIMNRSYSLHATFAGSHGRRVIPRHREMNASNCTCSVFAFALAWFNFQYNIQQLLFPSVLGFKYFYLEIITEVQLFPEVYILCTIVVNSKVLCFKCFKW